MNTDSKKTIGIDVGTSGVRALCINADLSISRSAQIPFSHFDGLRRDPVVWTKAVSHVIADILASVDAASIAAIAIDGTSGTMIATDINGASLSLAKMYNDTCNDSVVLEQISRVAPTNSAAHGASSGLAKAIELARIPGTTGIAHEADWLSAALSGVAGVTDENNALKTGYDPVESVWPNWIEQTDLNMNLLPTVLRAGEPIGPAVGSLAKSLGLSETTLIVAGTTDGCASFLATGATKAGEGVSALGSTLTIKLLSDVPIFAPEYGIYSHKIGDTWLAGGASNTGGAVLAHYFSDIEIAELSARIDMATIPDLNYYPLVNKGERFPINDNNLEPIVTPRPESDVLFLHGLLEGITQIEKLAYQRLAELGGPDLVSLRTVGGGAKNDKWTQLREKMLGVSLVDSMSVEAAMGAAVLAQRGVAEAGAA